MKFDEDGKIVRRRYVANRSWCGHPVTLSDGTITGCQLQRSHHGGHSAGFVDHEGVLFDYPVIERPDPEPEEAAAEPPLNVAARVIEMAVGKLHLEPGDVLIISPSPGSGIDSAEEARQLQEAVVSYLKVTNKVMVLPPATVVTVLAEPEAEAALRARNASEPDPLTPID